MTALDMLKIQLILEWDETDMETKAKIDEEYKALPDPKSGMKAFSEAIFKIREKYSKQQLDLIHMTDEDIHRANVKAADKMIQNLIQRVEKKVGKITDYSGLQTNPDNEGFMILNGWFVGENGRCEVQSISAGGYNIQKRHIRVLVK